MHKVALVDLDAMLHIVANVQYSAGNHRNKETTKLHVKRFISTILQNSDSEKALLFYQKLGNKNFRKDILPEYKGHRTKSDAVALWESTIIEAFEESGAIGLSYIESDDAISILAEKIGYSKVVIVSSDKDMRQVPTTHYNPFKQSRKGKFEEQDRWVYMDYVTANRFFWAQVLAGDATDMPNSLCGIEGVGMATAFKILDADEELDKFSKCIAKTYSKKYGKNGFSRANLTYKMVRLLRVYNNNYINDNAKQEVDTLLKSYQNYFVDISNSVHSLFRTANNLFNSQ